MGKNGFSKFLNCFNRDNPDSVEVIIAGCLPVEIEAGVAMILEHAPPDLLNDFAVSRFRQLIKSRGRPNYVRDWASFNYLYFGANYVKNYLVGRRFPIWKLNGSLNIVDLGSGSGASIAGFLHGLKDQHINTSRITNIVAVDSCEQQLKVFQSGVIPWLKKIFPLASIKIENADIFSWCSKASSDYNIILASYVCSELDDKMNTQMRQVLKNRFDKGSCVLQIVESKSGSKAITVEDFDGNVCLLPYDHVSLEVKWKKILALKESPKFSINEAGSNLISDYFKAWVNHDIKEIERIFDAEAIYEIRGVKTLFGISEIVSYWEHNAARQRNIRYSFADVQYFYNHVTATWKASFERVDIGENRILDGMIDLAIKNGKILKLVEAYSQKRTPILHND